MNVCVGIGEAGVDSGDRVEVGVPAAAAVDFAGPFAVGVVACVESVAVVVSLGGKGGGGVAQGLVVRQTGQR
ncbi:hypothetical protein ACFC5Z_27565 [Streptomyces sp. NPDC056004]|uniref:hypothetical protein n=1 Tax=Streptomyces sp. NPDC056004 TaxID=3345677 RepID=UPI0035DFF2F8